MQEIEALIANDQLREALDRLLAHSRWSAEQRADLLQLSAQLTAQERSATLSNQTYETLTVQRNQIRGALLRYTAPQSAVTPTSGGSSIKKHAFYLLLSGKLLLLLLVAFHYSTGGFSNGEALILVTILSPSLAGYWIKAAPDHDKPLSAGAIRRYSALRIGVYGLLPLYFMLTLWILNQTPRDVWDFDTTRNWLLGIEASFGALLLWLVNTLFAEKE